MEKIYITGTGRAGTTFLVRLFTLLNFDTGFNINDLENVKKYKCNSELEKEYSAKPYIIKSPFIITQIEEIINSKKIKIKKVIIPIRNLEDAAKSRLRHKNDNGGLWNATNLEEQISFYEKIIDNYKILMEKYNIDTIFLDFDNMISNSKYLYDMLYDILKEQNISFNDFEYAYKIADSLSKKSTICLNMIVKNEKHIIKETLDNLTKYINFSYWVISDTGSTDGTQEFIKEYFKEKNIPGELFQDEWQDFAYNRNLAIEHAFNKSDYLFFFDADDLIHGDFKLPDKLCKDVYQFKFSQNFSYDRICLINNREKIGKYVGVLHELFNINKPYCSIEKIEGDYFFESRHLGDRSKNPEKYKKDGETLEIAFNNEMTDLQLKCRYAYYCGQSYQDAGIPKKSIEWYKKFLDLPADNQYKYCACINLGHNYKHINNNEQSIYYYGLAYKYDTTRIEGITFLMDYYYSKDLHFMVNALWNKFKNYEILNPKHKIFLNIDRYRWFEWYNIVSGFYSDDYEGAYSSCKRSVINNYNIPNVLQNLIFYKKQYDNDNDNDNIVKRFLFNHIKNNNDLNNFNRYSEFIKSYSREKYDLLYDHFNTNNIDKSSSYKSSNKILIYTGYMNFLWNDSTLKNKSLGGAEKAVIYLSRCLPKNYEIYIAGDQLEEQFDNIKYVNHSNLQKLLNDNSFHTIIVSRYVSFFEQLKNIKCGQLVLSAHDTYFLGNNNEIIKKYNKYIDICVCLTEWHKNNFIEKYNCLKDKFRVINNGINIIDFNNENISLDIKVKNKFVWSSRPERGLNILLELWPKILEKIPDATLDICSYDNFTQETMYIKNIIDNNPNITYHGKLNTKELYKLINSADYWLYTCTWPETSCITAMEMLMCGVICLYYPIAGLNDTIGEYGIKVERGNEIETILNLSKERKTRLRKKGKEYALSCRWENRAEEWSNMLRLNNFKEYSISDERIRYLHNNYTLPEDHRNFLKKLGSEFKPNVIYDIGANVLNWTKEAHKIWNDSEICVFDAVKSFENFYKSQGYKYFTGVLSDSNDKYVKFYQNNEHPAGNSYYKEIGHKNSHIIYPESNYTNEKTITLSKVVNNLKFPMPDLIKFDVQGAELDIIKGSLDIINYAKYLIVEIQNKQYNRNAPLFDETVNFLEMNGWELITKKPFCDNGPDGDYCFKKRNKIGIFNSFHYHYEMFGFILNYALNHHIEVDIFTNTENHLGWIEFYRETFNNFNIIDFKKFNGNTANYLSFFVTTDDDPLFKPEWIDKNVVCLNHFYKIRTPNFKHYLNIAKFNDSLLDYTYPCYPLIDYKEKKLNNTVSIVGAGGGGLNFNIINRLYSSSKIQLNIIVRKSYNIDIIELDTTKFNINFMEDIDTISMIKTLKQSSYILINYNSHPHRENGMSCSGSLQLALSTLCRPIMSQTSNKYLQIENALEFDMESDEPINIDGEIDFKAIEQERNKYIDMFDNYITKIKQKQVALIVEPRKLEKLDKIITNIHNKLNNNSRYKWYILFYCGKGLKTYYLSLFHNIDITIIELDTNNFTFMEYNDFLKSLSLWNTINSEYTLVFQADCYIFNNPPYTIDYFIDKNYSYIGGNMSYQWKELEYHKTNLQYRNFNGGLSLRKTKDMINIIHSFKPQQSIEKLDKFETYGEDVYSTIGAYKLNLKIGNTKDDQHFACHSIITDKCFGIHNSDAYLDKKQLLDIYPEIYNQPYIINDNVKKELVIKNMYINNDCWSVIEDDNIIFMETNEIDKEFLSNKKSPFVLVTANNLDYPSGHNNDIEILNNPYLIKWFGTFPAISHPKFSPLPLGPKANWKETMILSEYMNTNIYDIASKDINPLVHNRKSLLYCNFSNTTSNPYIKEHKNCRIKLWEILKNIKIPVTNGKSQKDYLTDLSIYVYCLCPPGNGCDSHRLWEALMMNCIPVVIKYEPISELYKNLPVLVLDKWEDLTVELLNSKKEYFSNFDFNRELIYKKYYIDKIKKEAQPICKLQQLQNKIKITGGDFKEELIEQIIATKYINENDKVLEIGGNIGRNSMIIASLLNKTENLTVMETDQKTFKILKHNKEINNMNFKIINAGLSKKKLLQNSWDTYYSDSIENKHNYFKVNNITYQDLINKTGGDFNVLVLDCEGAFYYILKEFPEIITNIDKILIENDYKTIEEKKYVDDILFNNNFVSVFKDYHPDKWGPFYNKFYEVYIKTIKQKN